MHLKKSKIPDIIWIWICAWLIHKIKSKIHCEKLPTAQYLFSPAPYVTHERWALTSPTCMSSTLICSFIQINFICKTLLYSTTWYYFYCITILRLFTSINIHSFGGNLQGQVFMGFFLNPLLHQHPPSITTIFNYLLLICSLIIQHCICWWKCNGPIESHPGLRSSNKYCIAVPSGQVLSSWLSSQSPYNVLKIIWISA